MYVPILLLLAAAPAGSQSWTFNTDGTPDVRVAIIDGSIKVQAVDGNQVSVEAETTATSSADQPTKVEVWQEGDVIGVKLCCGACERKANACKGKLAKVRLSLKVPRQSAVSTSAVTGTVSVRGVGGAQEHSTVDGAVSVTGSGGDLSISTVGADVKVAPKRLADPARLSLSSVGGDIELSLPAATDAELRFTSVGGRLDGERVTLGSRSRTLGRGGARIDVNTVDGDLSVTAH